MGLSSDPRVDAYIARSPSFARPILAEARARVHQTCPAVEAGDAAERAPQSCCRAR